MGETVTIAQALQIAVSHHRAGRLAEAEGIYRQVLAAQPGQSDALRLLGVLARQAGQTDPALHYLREAVRTNPGDFSAFVMLGELCGETGQWDEAAECFARALALDPGYADGHYQLGMVAQSRSRTEEACAHYGRALALQPGHARAWLNLGVACQELGHQEKARASFERALAAQPDYAEAHNNLGVLARIGGQPGEARKHFERALSRRADYAEARGNLGLALADLGEFEKAVPHYERALALRPQDFNTHNSLGVAWQALGKFQEATACYKHALALAPDFADARNNLASVRQDLDSFESAARGYGEALALRPDDPVIHSNFIYALHLQPGTPPAAIAAELRRWNERHAAPLRPFRRPHANTPDPERRLRVGYVSADFYEHAVSYFFLPLLEAHDWTRFEVFCYSGAKRPDAVTARLRRLADGWREAAPLSDEALAEQVRADGIDLLVDLSLHTAGHRLGVFARQPAPVQVSWLGYPGSTGLETIRYRLTDARIEPPELDAVNWSSEERVRLPDCWCCYRALEDTPPASELPALASGALTFGALNNFSKANEPALRLWARALAAAAGSRLLMRCPPDSAARGRVCSILETAGIKPARVEFTPRWEPTRGDYLRHFARIDVALDTTLYNGTTTTCDALWMGVPVLTLPGDKPASRAGLSLLSAAGLPEFAAWDEADFARITEEYAADLPRLAALRASLRKRLRGSPLMDAPRFARNVEAAYRTMWRRWSQTGRRTRAQ